ncbi:MAG: prepilin-type N-terminal cleavage/methylation domain-containing protein [Myxococcales bacterium]|nr:MAG: prepilin-type N-terminal cleavage/methylation domain-containing protein [Myxococcales bacterium]
MQATMAHGTGMTDDARRGFTILEVMMSVFLLSIGLFALAAMQILGLRGNAGGEDRSNAAAVLTAKVNELAGLRYIQDPNSGEIDVDPRLLSTGGSFAPAVSVNAAGFTAQQVAARHPGAGELDRENFNYTLQWQIDDCSNLACTEHQTNLVGSFKRIWVRVTYSSREGEKSVPWISMEINNIPILPRFVEVSERRLAGS